MSANVWLEEVEKALVTEIRNSVKYLNNSGLEVPLDKDRVFVRDPEEDLTDEFIPCVTISQLSNQFNPRRYHYGDVKVSEIPETREAILEKTAVPFDLSYQIDFWTRFKEDINLMTRTWLISHARQFNLPVIDDGGTSRTCNVLNKEGIKEINLLANQKRLYHSTISYTIWVELDDEVRYNKHMVTERTINNNEEGGNP